MKKQLLSVAAIAAVWTVSAAPPPTAVSRDPERMDDVAAVRPLGGAVQNDEYLT